jgi:hypothetical protein
MSDLSTQLREYLDATAPRVELDEVTTDEVWVPVNDRRRHLRWGFPGWAYGVAAMVVVLALALGLAGLLRGADEHEVVDEPTPTTDNQPSTTIQPQPPPDLSGGGGTLDTALGSIPWVHAAEQGLIPHLGVIQTPSGFAGITEKEIPDGRYERLWITSPDGVIWTEAPFPVPLDPQADVMLGETQGRFWLTDGARLWLSHEAEVWTEIDLSEITPPPSAGIVWVPRLESPAVSGDLAVFPLQLQPELPIREIFDPGSEFTGGVRRTNCGWDWELEACQEVADDVDIVFGVDRDTGEETLLARFRLEAGEETAYVVNIDTGTRVNEFSVAGFNGQQLTRIAGSDLHWNAVLLVGSESTASVVEPPWSRFGLRHFFVAAVDGRFVAYVDSDPRPPAITLDEFEVWESDTGQTWTNRGTVDFGIEAPGEVHVMMFEGGDHVVAHIMYDLQKTLPNEVRLISTNGLDWEPDAADATGWIKRIQDGFVSFGDGAVLVSAEGDLWEELIAWNPSIGDIAFTAGDTLIVALANDGTYDVWSFDLES